MQPLRDGIARGPWPDRHMLFVPLSAAGALHQHASQLGGRTGVQVSITPQAVKPSDAWASISNTWNRVRGDSSLPRCRRHQRPVTAPSHDPIAVPRAAAPGGASRRAPLPMQPMPPTRPSAAAGEPNNPWQAYVRQCIDITGMISCCVFELGTQRTLAHAGAAPARLRWRRRAQPCTRPPMSRPRRWACRRRNRICDHAERRIT